MAQRNVKMDDDSQGMLEDLIDLDRAKCGESSGSKVIRDLIRGRHRTEFPEQWNGSFFKHYTKTA